jgi:hypothetical protein
VDEIEHVNPKRVPTRLTADGLLARRLAVRADPAALHERAAAMRHVDRPTADAQAIHRLSRGRRAS